MKVNSTDFNEKSRIIAYLTVNNKMKWAKNNSKIQPGRSSVWVLSCPHSYAKYISISLTQNRLIGW